MEKDGTIERIHFDLYEATLNDLPEGVLWTEAENTIVYLNNAAANLFGQAKKELLDQPFTNLVKDDSFKRWLELLDGKPDGSHYENAERSISVYSLVSLSINNARFTSFLVNGLGQTGREPSEMLRIISEGTAPVIGGDFFKSLAYHVIISTGIRYAIVTECANVAKTRVRTLVYIEREQFLDNFEYDLTGTPCEIVMRGDNYYCTADLDTFFPQDEGVKSYFGVPIFLSNGEVIGHIAIFDTKPMTISAAKLNILKIFASRAGAEIERKRKDEQIEGSMIRYQGLFEDSPIGLCEEDFSEVKKYIDLIKQQHKDTLASIFQNYPEEIRNAYRKIKRLSANKSQVALFDFDREEQYFNYLANHFMPAAFKDLILTFDSNESVFEREIEIVTAKGTNKMLKVKRVLLPGSEFNWSKSLISCVDITEQKKAEEGLKNALGEVKKLKERLEAENMYLQQEIKQDHNFEDIVSKSAQFKHVLEKIEQVADTDATVLILGESGTGKELIARGIHSVSNRNNRPLVKVNCAALPANLIESELFGHEKGAFTGALTQKIGRFELANGGTLFLDEIGEMPIELQSKLLRVLQEGEFERVGSSKTIRVDVRIIAATNRELEVSVNNKEFRADLYYRLNVFPIHSPALRDRKEDIPVLVNHFCKKYGAKFGKKITAVPKSVLETLMMYDWPGNVRELENIIERGLIVSKTNALEIGDWLPNITSKESSPTPVIRELKTPAAKSLEEVERQHILEVLMKTNWKIRGDNGAAKALELNPTTLEARMKKLGIVRK
ncbi:MAG TPA: sigma 54-interacting transcriptional regulator [Chryseolinea sp.]